MKLIRIAKQWSWFSAVTIAALFIGSSCRRSSAVKEERAPSRISVTAAATEAARTIAPEAGLTINRRGGEVGTYPGWPILVELSLRHPQLYESRHKVEPLLIASSGDSWSRSVLLPAKDAQQAVMTFPFKAASPGEAVLTLDAEKEGTLGWWLAGEDTAAILEGDYQLTATLDTSGVNKPGLWKGTVVSEPVVLHFKKEPSPLSDDLAEEKQLLLSACAHALGDEAKAGQYLDALLKAQPESIQGLAMKAGWLERSGDMGGAKLGYEKAIALFGSKYPDADPPRELWQDYDRLIDKMFKK